MIHLPFEALQTLERRALRASFIPMDWNPGPCDTTVKLPQSFKGCQVRLILPAQVLDDLCVILFSGEIQSGFALMVLGLGVQP